LHSLPRETSSRGKVRLGIRADENREFAIDPSWFTRSAVIVGKSGTGKSHDIDLIARQLGELGFSVVILDRTGEHSEALAGLPCAATLTPGQELCIPILDPTDQDVKDAGEAVEDALDTLSHYFAVSFGERPTPLQQRIVRENLASHYGMGSEVGQAPSVSEFISSVRRYQEFKRGIHGFVESCESVVSRLYPLTVGRTGEVFDQKKRGLPIEDLFKPGVHTIDLSRLRYEPARDLLSQIVVKRLYQGARRLGVTGDLRQLIVVDEAHHIAPRDPDYQGFAELIAIENRKFGQGVVVSSTSPGQLSEALLRNSSIRVCHQLDDGKDIDLMLRFMVNRLDSERFLADIRALGLGEALVQVSSPIVVEPTMVRVLER
jgi:hypothetical protein